ncbi:peptidylprolyl isomerase [uncultured Paludibaculum sp.]|uniref:peptidylprolyl isomerase n=1 Tax=uncultured Paludibaculum sp. TaxID=1765020 RepID=UPI002AABDDAB|nr:peptidylprolyl isomerase [uncultured Paludibaculum sp.]
MKFLFFCAPILCTVLSAQTTPTETKPAPAAESAPSLKDDKVVAVIDGKEWKRSDLEHLVKALGRTIPSQFYSDKRAFLKTLATMEKLASMAETKGLDKVDPHKWVLMYNRELYLAQIFMSTQKNSMLVMPEDQKAYYEAHKADYSQAKVKVIYLAFNDNPLNEGDPRAKKPKTSSEAEKLAEQVIKSARSGTDFVELVQKYSDDADSKAKKGDFSTIRPNDNSLPSQIKSAVFALKPGQISDAVRQTGGFWIFRLEEFVTSPYDEVRDDIYLTIQGERFKQWMDGMQKNLDVQFKDDTYLDYKSPIG